MAEEPPDIYCDAIQIFVSSSDVMFGLLKRAPASTDEHAPLRVGFVRTSLEHAKEFAIMLKTSLKQLEEQQGCAIPIHPEIRKMLGISKNEDW